MSLLEVLLIMATSSLGTLLGVLVGASIFKTADRREERREKTTPTEK